MNRRTILFALLLFSVVPLSGFAQSKAPAPLTGKLVITGSSTMAPLIEELGRQFQKQHPGVAITVEAGGSGRGVADTLAGKADIGMVSRDLAPNEKSLFAISIARDGVALVVHKSNPVGGLTKAQATDVFTGKIDRWKALGGADARIEVLTRTAGHSTLEILSHYLGIAPTAIKATQAFGDSADAWRAIALNRHAVGFLSVGSAEKAASTGAALKLLSLDGALPGSDSIRDGSWPLARPLNLVSHRVPTGIAKAFVEFALSPAAQPTILEFDFVSYLK